MFGFGKRGKPEARNAVVPVSSPNFLEFFGIGGDHHISFEDAIGVPAIWGAVNFISGTIAGLPLHVYDKTSTGKKRVKASRSNPIVSVLHDAVNDDLTSFQWRYNMMQWVLTEGREVTYIERDAAGRPINLYPLIDPTVKRDERGRKTYETRAGGVTRTYQEREVIDLTFMVGRDRLQHRSPLRQCVTAISKAANANEYGSKLFKNGGLPAFTLQGPFGSEKAASRASVNIEEATKEAARRGANVLSIPLGHKLEPLSSDPEKMQLIETQRFAVEEIARIYSLPPTFLQDLTHGTFSNTEQQDLHFVKHTLKRWTEQIEAEMNLKLFGRGSNRIVEFNMDGLLRGDYKTRMEGNARAIQTGQLTPNEARANENRPPMEGGDTPYMQGANLPLDVQSQATIPTTNQPIEGLEDDT